MVGACRDGVWVLQGPQGLPQLLLLLQVAPAHQVGPAQRCQILLLRLGQLARRLQGVCMCSFREAWLQLRHFSNPTTCRKVQIRQNCNEQRLNCRCSTQTEHQKEHIRDREVALLPCHRRWMQCNRPQGRSGACSKQKDGIEQASPERPELQPDPAAQPQAETLSLGSAR